ncbi:MAG: hypothetical protein QOK29_4956 [Rhodospirillaceae bacterium]|jgi:Flp pilus assembly protein TadD|nr:hypothetical protein [Rhodospirillaceae bacterium]
MAIGLKARSSFRRGNAATLALAVGLALTGCASNGNQPGSSGPGSQLSADTLMRVADETRNSGDLATAAGLYERAHDMDPQKIEPLLGLGTVWAQLRQPKSAADAWQAALAIDPKNTTALRGLANAEIQTGNAAAAIRHLQTASVDKPDWRTKNSLGVAYDMLGDHASAQSAYRAGLTVAPDNLQLLTNLGLSLTLSGNFPEALAMLGKAARDPAAGARQRQNLALAYGLSGNDQKAAEILKADLDPAKIQENLGYYEYLRLLHDRKAVAAAIGAHQANGQN